MLTNAKEENQQPVNRGRSYSDFILLYSSLSLSLSLRSSKQLSSAFCNSTLSMQKVVVMSHDLTAQIESLVRSEGQQ